MSTLIDSTVDTIKSKVINKRRLNCNLEINILYERENSKNEERERKKRENPQTPFSEIFNF